MLKAGILGCGSIAQKRHIIEMDANPLCEIVAYYDPAGDRADSMAKKYGGTAYKSSDEIINHPNIDFIVVATPNRYHAEYSIKALEAGKHVLCEKPMATNLKDAKAMIKAAKKTKKQLMIGLNQRLMPAHIKAKEVLKSGKIGEILTFETTFGHGGAENWSIDGNSSTWFFKKEEATFGAMGDLGVHKTDLMRWLLEDEIKEVSAIVTTRNKKYDNGQLIDIDDNAICLLKCKSGTIGTLSVSWTYYGGGDNGTIIRGEKGALFLSKDSKNPLVIKYPDKTDEVIEVEASATNDKQTDSGVSKMFVDSIVNNENVEIDGYQGYKALEAIVACCKSAQRGRKIKI